MVNAPSLVSLDPLRSLSMRNGPCAAKTPNNTVNATVNATVKSVKSMSKSSGSLQVAGRSLTEGRRESLQLKTFQSRDMRRKCLELLSQPDLQKIAQEMFKKSDVDSSGQLDFDEVHKVLEQLHEDMEPWESFEPLSRWVLDSPALF